MHCVNIRDANRDKKLAEIVTIINILKYMKSQIYVHGKLELVRDGTDNSPYPSGRNSTRKFDQSTEP